MTWTPESNEARADKGAEALEAYAQEHDRGEPTFEVLTDLLSDLMHTADRYGVDFTAAMDMAWIHHLAEVDEQGEVGRRPPVTDDDPEETWGNAPRRRRKTRA